MTRRLPVLVLALAAASACTTTELTDTTAVVGGDPERGRAVIRERGCASCHQIPGIDQPQGRVGPPLGDFADRAAIAGQLPNNVDNAVTWISDPRAVEPDTLMPDLGVTDAEALDIVAYLYGLG